MDWHLAKFFCEKVEKSVSIFSTCPDTYPLLKRDLPVYVKPLSFLGKNVPYWLGSAFQDWFWNLLREGGSPPTLSQDNSSLAD